VYGVKERSRHFVNTIPLVFPHDCILFFEMEGGPTNRREARCFPPPTRERAHEQKKSQWLLGFEQAFGGGGRGHEKDFSSLTNLSEHLLLSHKQTANMWETRWMKERGETRRRAVEGGPTGCREKGPTN
jgi:hypothetical protein